MWQLPLSSAAESLS